MNKALHIAAVLSIIAFAVYAVTCVVLGNTDEAYGYICAVWWAMMFLMFDGGDEK